MNSPSTTRVFLVTANIASCFEQPEEMLNPWLDEFFKSVVDHSPKFIALHCQEVGGKNYETSMKHVDEFLRNLISRAKELGFSKGRIFLDEDFTCAEKFTALGNIYFLHNTIEEAFIWDFVDKEFVHCEGIEEFVGDIQDISLKEKAKFPQEFFPECKWSRKGFMRTRWRLNGSIFDLVNIHLFHDASNIIAMEKFPSAYTLNRKRAIEHTLDRFHNDEYENVPFFIFGDFNFRLDTGGVVQTLTEECSEKEIEISGEKTCEYKDEEGKTLLSVSKKSFSHSNHHSLFLQDGAKWLQPFDKELSQFSDRLSEFPINFPPSYPFVEGNDEPQAGNMYMQTRCPSWCDRVVFSTAAKELVEKSRKEIKYDLIGFNRSMGDHKPVGLKIELPKGAGIVECCSLRKPCQNYVHSPSAPCFTASAWCRCLNYSRCPGLGSESDSRNNEAPAAPPSPPVLRNLACHSKDRQCVCSVDPNESNAPDAAASSVDKTDSILKNILNLKTRCDQDFLSDDKQESLLKRVHSDPIKVKTFMKKHIGDLEHSNLAHSQSLDSKCKGDKESTLRLRAGSSRLLSHHSSSSEEWFEEVAPANDKVAKPLDPKLPSEEPKPEKSPLPSVGSTSLENPSLTETRDFSYVSEDSSVDIFYSKKPLNEDYSLNNLLLSDSLDGHLDEIDSLTYSQATTAESVKTTPDTRLLRSTDAKESNKNACHTSEISANQSRSSSSSKCCCVLS